jgi:phosphoglycerate kinase
MRTIEDLGDLDGKRVLVRVDFNVPLDDGRITDDVRIRAALPTLERLRGRGARLVLTSHLGRPKDRDPALSLRPVAERLTELLGIDVELAPDLDHVPDGDVVMLENIRYEPGETANDPELARRLASLADLYVDDAFGAAHRAHATTAGVARLLPAYAGLLLEREVEELTAVRDDPAPPLRLLLGGAKVSDKVGVIERFLDTADQILIGGAMCFSFLAAMGVPTGDSLLEAVDVAERLLERGQASPCDLALPVDLVCGRELAADTERRALDGVEVPEGWMGLDVGARTAASYGRSIASAGTVFWNGPMGAFELRPFAEGTRAVAEAVASAPGTTVVGGGDTVAALDLFGLADGIDWVSSGGGASLELLEGRELPGVEALLDAEAAAVPDEG